MAPSDQKSIADNVRDLWHLLIDYARQEMVDPLKGLGRYVGWGVGGALTLGVGVVLLGLAGLRALQTETGDVFDGNWTFAPYLLVFVYAAMVIALAVSRIGKEPKRRA